MNLILIFTSIGSKLASKIPKTSSTFSEYLSKPIANSIFFTATDEIEVEAVVKILKIKSVLVIVKLVWI